MSKEILEKALDKTNEIQEKEDKRNRTAARLGMAAGISVAVALDATLVWGILVYLCGITLPWTAALGWTLLAWVFVAKIRKS